jgi:hypothetical protein
VDARVPNSTGGSGYIPSEGFWNYISDEADSRKPTRDNTSIGSLGLIMEDNTAIDTDNAIKIGTGTYNMVVEDMTYTNVANQIWDLTGTGCTHAAVPNCPSAQCTTWTQCIDQNPCTADTCRNGACVHTALAEGASCTDKNVCNGAETCRAGRCVAGSPLSCDDGNRCTTDACNAASGCMHTTATSCDDGNACTADACTATGCSHTPIPNCQACKSAAQCNDANPCTADACSAGRCTHAAAATASRCVS